MKKRETVRLDNFKIRSVYPQMCANHPDVVDDLYYVYNGIPDPKSGQLLCEECRNNEDVETDQR